MVCMHMLLCDAYCICYATKLFECYLMRCRDAYFEMWNMKLRIIFGCEPYQWLEKRIECNATSKRLWCHILQVVFLCLQYFMYGIFLHPLYVCRVKTEIGVSNIIYRTFLHYWQLINWAAVAQGLSGEVGNHEVSGSNLGSPWALEVPLSKVLNP